MATITLKDIALSFGGLPLLNGIELQIDDQERLKILRSCCQQATVTGR